LWSLPSRTLLTSPTRSVLCESARFNLCSARSHF
jgi:hypothetical protein